MNTTEHTTDPNTEYRERKTKMKSIRKIMTLTIAMLMMIGMGTAVFADDPAPTPAPAYDYPLTVTGLAEGDTVKFYQVVEWVGETTDKSDVSGWKALDTYKDVLTKEVLTAMLVGDPKADPAVAATGMTSEIAGKLAALASGGADATKIEKDASGDTYTATYNNAKSGMYMALVTPADANTVYNPVFVSADYNKETGHTGTAAVTGAFADGVAKKSSIPLTKTAANASDYNGDKAKTTAVGDTVTFTVNTAIPGYGSVYEHPHFELNDTLTDLKLKKNDDGSYIVSLTAPAELQIKDAEHSEAGSYDYEISATDAGYTITFAETYLKTVETATDVTVTYQAVVTSSALKAINEETNDVYITYSHDPNNQSDYDVKKDTTQHYTFTLDAAGAGEGTILSGKKTSELVKVGVDAAGNPILTGTQTSEITASEKWEGPLEKAEFGLWKSSDCKGDPYLTASTGTDGRMTFAGLDAGTYYLKEISAPAGYVTDSTIHTVKIEAETDNVKVTEWWNGSAWVSTKPESGTAKEVTYETDILKSYTVTIDGKPTATYTFTNQATANSNEIQWETVEAVEKPFELKNTQGTELPSTGGIGTTIFYALGGIMILGAGVLLVSKKRMAE